MIIRILTLIAAVLQLSSSVVGAETNSLPALESAYATVASAPAFSFGGVGIGGVTSEAERAFSVLQSGPNALHFFVKLTGENRSVANLYGLAGIRLIASDREFDKHAARFRSTAKTALTTLGGVTVPDYVTNIISRVRAGEIWPSDAHRLFGNPQPVPGLAHKPAKKDLLRESRNDLEALQGDWGSYLVGFYHRDGNEVVYQPTEILRLTHRIQGNKWIELSAAGKPTGLEKTITLKTLKNPKRMELTHTLHPDSGKPANQVTEQILYVLEADRLSLHSALDSGMERAPEQLLESRKPVKGRDGRVQYFQRMKAE